jgi:YtkA-like
MLRSTRISSLAALSCIAGLLLVPAAQARSAQDAAKTRAKVTFELGARTGYEYRWEFGVAVRVRARATGKPIPNLKVAAAGRMDLPGHHMATGSVPLRYVGGGVYRAKVAFYMPGEWRVLVSVKGAKVVSSVTPFEILLK